MSLKSDNDIFRSTSQHIDHAPEEIRLIEDRVLIKELPVPQDSSKLVQMPQAYQQRGVDEWGSLRIGLVVAVGPGDRFIEKGVDDDGRVRRVRITTKEPCGYCYGKGKYFNIYAYEVQDCSRCHGIGKEPVLVPPQCKPGDKVLYSRRREAEVFLRGELYSLVHAEQSVLAVLED